MPVDVIGLAVQGFFTGVGVQLALYCHEEFVKPRLEAAKLRSKEMAKNSESFLDRLAGVRK